MEWDLATYGAISGSVVDPRGTGIAGLTVELQPQNHSTFFKSGWFVALGKATTSNDGSFHFDQLAPGGYAVGRSGAQPAFDTESFVCTVEEVVVESNAVDAIVQLVLRPAAFIAGQLLSAQGDGVAGAYVFANAGDGGNALGMTGAGGSFKLGPLPPRVPVGGFGHLSGPIGFDRTARCDRSGKRCGASTLAGQSFS